MRRILPLLLAVAPLTAFAGAPPICEPPPINTGTCPAGKSEVYYPGLGFIAGGIDSIAPCRGDLYAPGNPDLPGGSEAPGGDGSENPHNNFIRVCESDDRAPMTQAICVEQEDHSVICTGWPIGNSLSHEWSTTGALVPESFNGSVLSSVTLLCAANDRGTVSLSVTNAQGMNTVAVSDFMCTGEYVATRPPVDGEVPLCPECGITYEES
jgi:hypothetical protein